MCSSATHLLFIYYFRDYLTSSKVNTVVYQLYKYYMVQIWFLKFVKSVLDVIPIINFYYKIYSCVCTKLKRTRLLSYALSYSGTT